MKYAIVLLSAVFASAVVINAQQVVTLSTPGGFITSNYIMLESATFKGAPYAAETINENTQTLADGNHIVQHTTGRVYRDGEGRVRREEDGPPADGVGPDRPMVIRGPSISIVDPVAGESYTLDTTNRIAWKTSTGASAMILQNALKQKVQAVQGQENAVQFKVENGMAQASVGFARSGGGGRGGDNQHHSEETLAARQIEGVLAEGRRNTTTIPAGSIGNEQPITIVSEEWKSPDLGVLVMTSHKDPRNGESSYRLANIVRGEPDGSLFQVPSDYTVKETGVRRLEPTRQER
jgi:hypothetical protein